MAAQQPNINVMKIGILGTRGIPNNYGGFEQLAEYLSVALANKGHQVYVYCSSLHPYQEKIFNGVTLIHCHDPEKKLGTTGQFIYDLNCIIDSRNRNFDVLLQLGYTSSSVWWFLLPPKTKIITNMDGLEWKRSKYSNIVKWFLKHAEKWAVHSSPYLVADSPAIKNYLLKKYNRMAQYIAYGADVFLNADVGIIAQYQVKPKQYYLAIARFEPENNIETIIKGVLQTDTNYPLLLIGNYNNSYGSYLRKTYTHKKIIFVGSVYNMDKLNSLRFFCTVYFHGHTVGGTNPSLLEAMAASAYIVAHNNEFNNAVLANNASYFSSANDISAILSNTPKNKSTCIADNLHEISEKFSWQKIINQYETLMHHAIAN